MAAHKLPPEQTKTHPRFEGFHTFIDDDSGHGPWIPYGSFEVFFMDEEACNSKPGLNEPGCYEPGWYWWACFPGCLPDGEATGPFPTAEGAYLDAIGD